MNRLLFLLLVALMPSAGRSQQSCLGPSPVLLTEARIGSLATRLPLDSIRSRCPRARRTTAPSYESVWPALEVSVGELHVLAVQYSDSIDFSQPADAWWIKGCGARLPGGVSTCATWSDLTRVHGSSGSGSTEFGPANVRLDKLPGFAFELDVRDVDVGSLEVAPDLRAVPGKARIVLVFLGR